MALATEAACSVRTGLLIPDIISGRAPLLLQVAELLLASDDLEAVVGEVERLLQQAKEADPANFEHLQVESPSSVGSGLQAGSADCPVVRCGMLQLHAGSTGEIRQSSLHLCCCGAALIHAEQMHLFRIRILLWVCFLVLDSRGEGMCAAQAAGCTLFAVSKRPPFSLICLLLVRQPSQESSALRSSCSMS